MNIIKSISKIFRSKKREEKSIDWKQHYYSYEPEWTGKDFEFFLYGDFNLGKKTHDELMTPNSFNWEKIEGNRDFYYKIENDTIYYSWMMEGVWVYFNEEISIVKAKQIIDEVIAKIIASGQKVELLILNKSEEHYFN